MQHLSLGPHSPWLAHAPGCARLASAISRNADDLGGTDRSSTLRIAQRSPAKRSSHACADCGAYAHAARALGLDTWRGPYCNSHTSAGVLRESTRMGR